MSTDSADPADRDRPDVARLAAHAVARPGTGGSTKALLGILLAGTAGMVIFLFVHLSREDRIHLFVHLSEDSRIRPGPSPAHTECTKGQRDCLPDVNYIDTAGVAYSHDSLAGKVVLVNFWATWCHPCEQEIPDLSKAYDRYKAKGVVFLGVLTDKPDSQQLLNFQSDHEITYPIVRANSDLMVSFDYPQALPTTLVFDRGGKQVLKRVGALRESDLDSLLGQLVAQN